MSLLGKAVIIPVQPEDIGHYQKIALPFIQSALEQTAGELTLEEILADVANRKRHLWLIKLEDEFLAGVVTQMYSTQSGLKIGEITMAGGKDYAAWSHFSDTIGQFFKAQGCKIMRVIGRDGWEKLLKPKGFAKKHIILDKELSDE